MAVTGARHVLVIAGSDCSGGAGIARDIETVAAFGIRTCPVVTAITAQTHDAVGSVVCTPPWLVAEQLTAALAANRVSAIKIGMLGTAGTVAVVVSALRAHPHIPVVLDPVLASSSGRPLLETEAIALLKSNLMPLCTLVTPNLIELAMLCGCEPAANDDAPAVQAQHLVAGCAQAVLVKGGHAQGELATDSLYRPAQRPVQFQMPRLQGEMRGTGCSLASAIAAGLAQDRGLETSVRSAKQYVFERISDAVTNGPG